MTRRHSQSSLRLSLVPPPRCPRSSASPCSHSTRSASSARRGSASVRGLPEQGRWTHHVSRARARRSRILLSLLVAARRCLEQAGHAAEHAAHVSASVRCHRGEQALPGLRGKVRFLDLTLRGVLSEGEDAGARRNRKETTYDVREVFCEVANVSGGDQMGLANSPNAEPE